jgi:hypothetical protein
MDSTMDEMLYQMTQLNFHLLELKASKGFVNNSMLQMLGNF